MEAKTYKCFFCFCTDDEAGDDDVIDSGVSDDDAGGGGDDDDAIGGDDDDVIGGGGAANQLCPMIGLCTCAKQAIRGVVSEHQHQTSDNKYKFQIINLTNLTNSNSRI